MLLSYNIYKQTGSAKCSQNCVPLLNHNLAWNIISLYMKQQNLFTSMLLLRGYWYNIPYFLENAQCLQMLFAIWSSWSGLQVLWQIRYFTIQNDMKAKLHYMKNNIMLGNTMYVHKSLTNISSCKRLYVLWNTRHLILKCLCFLFLNNQNDIHCGKKRSSISMQYRPFTSH